MLLNKPKDSMFCFKNNAVQFNAVKNFNDNCSLVVTSATRETHYSIHMDHPGFHSTHQ